MTYEQIAERSPEEIEMQIAETRASLDRKLRELERRLSPQEQLRRLRQRLDPEPLLPWAALAAITTGALLAAIGWRKIHRSNGAAGESADMELTSSLLVCTDADDLRV